MTPSPQDKPETFTTNGSAYYKFHWNHDDPFNFWNDDGEDIYD